MQIPHPNVPAELFAGAAEFPVVGDLMAWGYALQGHHSLARGMRQMAALGRAQGKPPTPILPFTKPEAR